MTWILPTQGEGEAEINIAHCWTHVDREFKEAKDPPAGVTEMRSLIKELYKAEKKVEGPSRGRRLPKKNTMHSDKKSP